MVKEKNRKKYQLSKSTYKVKGENQDLFGVDKLPLKQKNNKIRIFMGMNELQKLTQYP